MPAWGAILTAPSPKCGLGRWFFCWDKPTNIALAGFCDPVTFWGWVLCPSSAGIFAFWLGRTFFFFTLAFLVDLVLVTADAARACVLYGCGPGLQVHREDPQHTQLVGT